MAANVKPISALLPLQLHPLMETDSILALHGLAWRMGTAGIGVAFRIDGDMGDIIVPSRVHNLFREGLWTETCFEVFIGLPDSRAYYEINLSPSGEWCVYKFTAYREPPNRIDTADLALFEVRTDAGGLSMRAQLTLPKDERLVKAGCRTGLCAVIRHASDARSYWALTHPSKRPDFHDQRGFTAPFQQRKERS